MAEKGILPEPGGGLDQPVMFLKGCEIVWALNAYYKTELRKKAMRDG